MAISCKTVEFIFQTEQAILLADTERILGPISVRLPETGKVFRSVTLELGFTDELAASSTATGFEMKFVLDPSAPSEDATVSEAVTTTGESSVYHMSRDLTDYFNTAFDDGDEFTAYAAITVSTNATNNHWAKLRVTYDYEDESPRQTKTIWYPIESTVDLLTTTYQPVGGATAIPAIKGGASILPEHDITVQQVWIELLANQATTDATSFSLGLNLPADATEESTFYRVSAALATPGSLHAIWDVTLSELDRPQALEAKLTGVTDRVAQLCGWVGITYEFATVGTTLVWNSLMLPAFDGEDQHGSTTSERKTLHVKELWIAEPETITLQPSQAFAFYDDNGLGSSVSLWIGDQTPRSFATAATGAPMVIGQRMDATGTSGAGVALARGRNRIKVQQFGSVANAGAAAAVNGWMIINYTSGKSPAGMGAHNQTRHFGLGWPASGPRAQDYSVDGNGSRTPTIPADRYFLNAVALQTAWLSTDVAQQAFRVQAQRARGEGPSGDGVGWASAYRGAIASSPENWLRWTTADCTGLFRRWTGDPELARMDLETDRRWMVLDAASAWIGAIGLLVTYHTIAQTARGTVSGASADATGLLVSLSRDLTGEKVLEVVTTTGGVYEAAWYDDTEALVADVYEDDGHLGRSAPFFASGLYEPPPAPDPDPLYHSSTHRLGGADELDVSGLSGVLAEPQIAATHAASHASDGSDPIPAATTSVRGTVELATDGESASGLAVQADDARLSNPRTPTAHASSHASGGSDAIKLDDLATPDDNTDLNATDSHHGLLPRLSNAATEVLSGLGTWISAEVLDVQSWTTAGSYSAGVDGWVKPSRGSMAMIVVVGAGGGGGGGASGNSGGQVQGACAGGGGARQIVLLPLSALAATETVSVGAGGGGGSAGASGGVAPDGDDGAASYFGSSAPRWADAGGGGGGRRGVTGSTAGRGGGGGGVGGSGQLGGTTTGGSGGGPGVLGSDQNSISSASGGRGAAGGNSTDLTGGSAEYGGGGGGGRSSAVSSSAKPGGSSMYGGGGGGCGGGTTSGSVAQGGTAGGGSGVFSASGGGGGTAGTAGNNGGAGSAGNYRRSGSGGGGGGGDTTGSAGAGADGGSPGGGGGGGGSAYSAGTAGAGGDGGDGAVYVFVW